MQKKCIQKTQQKPIKTPAKTQKNPAKTQKSKFSKVGFCQPCFITFVSCLTAALFT